MFTPYLLTFAMAVAKISGVIAWPWWIVVAPAIIDLVGFIGIMAMFGWLVISYAAHHNVSPDDLMDRIVGKEQ